MGLDTTHDCWSGGYTGFGLFRGLVGRAAGMPYRKPNLMAGEFGLDVLSINWDTITEQQLSGQWGDDPTVMPADIYGPPITDPVLYLLVHYDCEGELRLDYLPALRARLEEIEPEYDRLVSADERWRRYASSLRRFIDGIGDAIEAGEHVQFH